MATKPLVQLVQEAIYQVRWVDAFGKDGRIATDEVIAEAVVKVLEFQYRYAVYTSWNKGAYMRTSVWFESLDKAKASMDKYIEWAAHGQEFEVRKEIINGVWSEAEQE